MVCQPSFCVSVNPNIVSAIRLDKRAELIRSRRYDTLQVARDPKVAYAGVEIAPELPDRNEDKPDRPGRELKDSETGNPDKRPLEREVSMAQRIHRSDGLAGTLQQIREQSQGVTETELYESAWTINDDSDGEFSDISPIMSRTSLHGGVWGSDTEKEVAIHHDDDDDDD